MFKINLQYNKGYKWNHSENIHSKGYLFDPEGNLHQEKDLNAYFSCASEGDFANKIASANGSFAIVIQKNNKLWVGMDRLRSIPLFYALQNNIFYLSDNAYWIKDELGLEELDKISEQEFLLTGYVTRNSTLYEDIKQIQAGEYLIFKKDSSKINKYRYFKYIHNNYFNENEDVLIRKLDKVHLNVFNRLVKYLNGSTAVIPLSGGYDSRLIVEMFKRLGYENVICFSYGKKNNWESKVSERVANKLGYKWFFLEETRDKWHEFYNSSERKLYNNFGSNFVSISHLQDYLAVKEMKEKKLIPKNSIILPGHTGDFVSGGHIPYNINDQESFKINDVVKMICDKHYNLWNWKNYDDLFDKFKDKIINIVGDYDNISSENTANMIELFDWQERQAKFIINSVRVYDFFGYKWALPLWDKEIINFWRRVPLKMRCNRKLYMEFVKSKSILKDVETNPSLNKISSIINRFLRIIYARYTKKSNIVSLLNSRVKDIKGDKIIINFIDDNDLLVFKSINGLSALVYINELLEDSTKNL